MTIPRLTLNNFFLILFGFGTFCTVSVIRGLLLEVWPPWPLVVALLAVTWLLFLAARRLLKPDDTNLSTIRFRKVSCWLSLASPFAAWNLCHCCEFFPLGMPITRICLAWHLGFLGSTVLGSLALMSIVARSEYKWIWMPIAGLALSIPLAASTQRLMYIL